MAHAIHSDGSVMVRLWPLLVVVASINLTLTHLRHCYITVTTKLNPFATAVKDLMSDIVIDVAAILLVLLRCFVFVINHARSAVTAYGSGSVEVTPYPLKAVGNRPTASHPDPLHTSQSIPDPRDASIPAPLVHALGSAPRSLVATATPDEDSAVETVPQSSNQLQNMSEAPSANDPCPEISPPTASPGEVSEATAPPASVPTQIPAKRRHQDDEEYDDFDVNSLQSKISPSRKLSPLLATTLLDRSSQAGPASPLSPTRPRRPAKTLDQVRTVAGEEGLRIGNVVISPPQPRRPNPSTSSVIRYASRAQHAQGPAFSMTPIFETTIEVVPVSEDAAAALIEEGESVMTTQNRRADYVTGLGSLHLESHQAQKNADVDDHATSESSFKSGDTELDDPEAGPVSKPKTASVKSKNETEGETSDDEPIQEDPMTELERQSPRGACHCWVDPTTYRLIESHCDIHRGWYPKRAANLRVVLKVFKYLGALALTRAIKINILRSALPRPGFLTFDIHGNAWHYHYSEDANDVSKMRKVSTFPRSAIFRDILRELQEEEYDTQSINRNPRLHTSPPDAQQGNEAEYRDCCHSSLPDSQDPLGSVQLMRRISEETYESAISSVRPKTPRPCSIEASADVSTTIASVYASSSAGASQPVLLHRSNLTKAQRKNAARRAKEKRDRQMAAEHLAQGKPLTSAADDSHQSHTDVGGSHSDPVVPDVDRPPTPAQIADHARSEATPGVAPRSTMDSNSEHTAFGADSGGTGPDESQAENNSPVPSTTSDPPISPLVMTPPTPRMSPTPRLSPKTTSHSTIAVPTIAPTSAVADSVASTESRTVTIPSETSASAEQKKSTGQQAPQPEIKPKPRSPALSIATPTRPLKSQQSAMAHVNLKWQLQSQQSAQRLPQVRPLSHKYHKMSKSRKSDSFPAFQQAPDSVRSVEPIATAASQNGDRKQPVEEPSESCLEYPTIDLRYPTVVRERPTPPSLYAPIVDESSHDPPKVTYPEIAACLAVPTVIPRRRSVSFNVAEARERARRWTGPDSCDWTHMTLERQRSVT